MGVMLDSMTFEQQAHQKIQHLEGLEPRVRELQRAGKKVVWTNGCFDLLHAGHVLYLMRARDCGDALIVGLNSDQSVRDNKGPGRPVMPEGERALLLAALSFVDYVTIFSEKSPLPLLEILRPDIYAKGGDYTLDTVVQEERRCVERYGGGIKIIPGEEGASTSNLVARVLRSAP